MDDIPLSITYLPACHLETVTTTDISMIVVVVVEKEEEKKPLTRIIRRMAR